MPDELPEDIREIEARGQRILVNRNICAAFKDCIGIAPEAFQLGDDGIVTFVDPASVDRERLVEACTVCPVKALIVIDESGTRIV